MIENEETKEISFLVKNNCYYFVFHLLSFKNVPKLFLVELSLFVLYELK